MLYITLCLLKINSNEIKYKKEKHNITSDCVMNFNCHRRGWLLPNQHRHRSVLSGLSGLCFLKKVKTAHHVCRAASHINATSFDPVIWSRVNAAEARERTVSPVESDWLTVGDTARLPPLGVRFPTPKRQHCRHSRNSLGTVLSETVATVSLSAPPRSRAVSN